MFNKLYLFLCFSLPLYCMEYELPDDIQKFHKKDMGNALKIHNENLIVIAPRNINEGDCGFISV